MNMLAYRTFGMIIHASVAISSQSSSQLPPLFCNPIPSSMYLSAHNSESTYYFSPFPLLKTFAKRIKKKGTFINPLFTLFFLFFICLLVLNLLTGGFFPPNISYGEGQEGWVDRLVDYFFLGGYWPQDARFGL